MINYFIPLRQHRFLKGLRARVELKGKAVRVGYSSRCCKFIGETRELQQSFATVREDGKALQSEQVRRPAYALYVLLPAEDGTEFD